MAAWMTGLGAMWIWGATAAGFTAIFCTTTIRTAGYPYWGSARSWESVSWGSPSAIIGAATTEAGPGMDGRTTGCTGRRRLGALDRRFDRILRRDRWCRRGLRGPTRHRVRDPRIARHRANRATVDLRVTADVRAMVGLRATADVRAMVGLRATADVRAMAGPRATADVRVMVGPQVTAGVQAMAARVTAGVRTMAGVHLGRIPNRRHGRADHHSRNPEPGEVMTRLPRSMTRGGRYTRDDVQAGSFQRSSLLR
jgi:hypothetical protein